jgi:hypothetical protein
MIIDPRRALFPCRPTAGLTWWSYQSQPASIHAPQSSGPSWSDRKKPSAKLRIPGSHSWCEISVIFSVIEIHAPITQKSRRGFAPERVHWRSALIKETSTIGKNLESPEACIEAFLSNRIV